MPSSAREIRDPIHVFVHVDENERRVLDSPPFQRLRNIHQLAMTYLIYPGASHKRFEHSLGVMHLVGQMFDVVTSDDKLTDTVREILPTTDLERHYWRTVLRMAALCHDIGHLPFSHAAEKELLPEGWTHETITRAIIESPQMETVWDQIRPKPEPVDIVKLALGPKEAPDLRFSIWQEILADLITGDVFGADRIDYLLRDSLHTGVVYGHFDHYRLIQTLKLVPPAATPPAAARDGEVVETTETAIVELGVERGGLVSAEGLQLARYFMFSQVYFHSTRMIYDIHLKEFLLEWLGQAHGGNYPTDVEEFLKLSDNEVLAAMRIAADSSSAYGHEQARRILERRHFRRFYSRTPSDVELFADAATAIYEAACREFSPEKVRYADSRKPGVPEHFTVEDRDGQSVSSTALSDLFKKLLQPKDEYVYIEPELREKAEAWLRENRNDVIESAKKEEQET